MPARFAAADFLDADFLDADLPHCKRPFMVAGRPLQKSKIAMSRASLVLIAAASLALCVALDLWLFPASTTFPDEKRFLVSAADFAASGEFWVGKTRAWEMPGTEIFFALFLKLFSGKAAALMAIRIAQAVLVALQSILIGALAGRLFRDSTAALIATLIAAFYPFYLFYQGLALSETLFDFLLVAGIALLYRWRDNGARINLETVLPIACLVAATMVKGALTALAPVLIAAAVIGRRPLPDAIKAFGAAALVYCVLMSPWWIRNYVLLDTFVPFTTSASENLYLGNSRGNPTGDPDWKPLAGEPLMRIPGEIERSKAYAATAIDYIRSEPAAFLSRMARKFVRFWNVVPNVEAYSSPLYKIISAATFGPVLALAIACGVLTRRRWRDFLPLYLLFLYFTALHVVTIASLRYRLPIEAFLIVLAAWPAALLWRRIVQRFRPAKLP
jgi:4-amino-4-deoxy-L-arabinose transferase-like glycosyltransferase